MEWLHTEAHGCPGPASMKQLDWMPHRHATPIDVFQYFLIDARLHLEIQSMTGARLHPHPSAQEPLPAGDFGKKEKGVKSPQKPLMTTQYDIIERRTAPIAQTAGYYIDSFPKGRGIKADRY